ncbi:ABC transporter ATP-binding protein, partial [bacterium]|nr:ABC transporter ATP-binding protein [bacterium]
DSSRVIAVGPQDAVIDFDFTCEEIVLMGRAPHLGRFESESEADRAVVREVMERTATWNLRDRSILEMSGGERQRVILARAFAQTPKVLLLDEPTAHLDVAFQVQILRMVKALRDEKKTAVLATIHDLNLAATCADRIVLLSRGRLLEIDESAEWTDVAHAGATAPPPAGATWRVETSEVELTPAFAKKHLKTILAAILDSLRDALSQEVEGKRELKERLARLSEAHKLLGP